MTGTLSIISTPIGNLEDITIRAILTLFRVDILLCEDTRRTGQLLKELKTRYTSLLDEHVSSPTLVSYYDEIEQKRLPEIIELLNTGKHVGLVSDNGTPAISDPGFRIIREALKRSISVTSIPGANAAVTALTSSGFPTDSFLFIGFLPEKESQRIKRLTELTLLPFSTTIISYCSPHKLQQTLTDIQQVYGTGVWK
jgi:16S rRNA (cytidine1402-2'-O)-methyltransferase